MTKGDGTTIWASVKVSLREAIFIIYTELEGVWEKPRKDNFRAWQMSYISIA